ncbi:MAG: DUF3106 domain-containing protein, partial [Neisseriaceae bacterium]|nr:DUF3106 domain-containing protein [Neisseriaceae bacterium]
MKKLKLISGAVAPAACVALVLALSQQAGAAKAPDTQKPSDRQQQQQQTSVETVFTEKQQKEIERIKQEVMNGKANSTLTPEQQKKVQDIQNGKSPLTPEQQKQAQDIMNGKSPLTPEQQKKVQDIQNGKSPLTPEQQKLAQDITNQLLNDNDSDKSGGLLQGDERLACEATMCLMASPEHRHKSYCKKSIAKYMAIRHKKHWHRTVEMRRDFLKKCPSDDDEKNQRIEKIVNQDYPDCSAAGLNKTYYWRGNRDRDTGMWSESGIKFVPSMVAKRCGAAWTSWAEYKCDEKQVPVYREDSEG